MRKEKDLHPKIKQWLVDSYPKCWYYKTHDGSTRGIPDIHAICGGHAVWIELKLEHKLTELQKYRLQEIQQAKGLAFVVKGYMICMVDDYDMDAQVPKTGWDFRHTTAHAVIHAALNKMEGKNE